MDTHKKYLQYGDIIRILSPTNSSLHDEDFLIIYLDRTKFKIISLDKKIHTLLIKEDGTLEDSKIVGISLLSSSIKSGYALQNSLIPNTWIDILFDFNIEFKLTGLITNLQDDRIEVSIWYENEKIMKDVIYIDFEYKGLPHKLHIKQIYQRESPESFYHIEKEKKGNAQDEEKEKEKENQHEKEKEKINWFEEDKSIIFFTQEKEEKDNKYELFPLKIQINDMIDNTVIAYRSLSGTTKSETVSTQDSQSKHN